LKNKGEQRKRTVNENSMSAPPFVRLGETELGSPRKGCADIVFRGLQPNSKLLSFVQKTLFVNLSPNFQGRIEPLRPSCLLASGFPSHLA